MKDLIFLVVILDNIHHREELNIMHTQTILVVTFSHLETFMIMVLKKDIQDKWETISETIKIGVSFYQLTIDTTHLETIRGG